jgi:poly(3-hydroxybutyrate) depolymerase
MAEQSQWWRHVHGVQPEPDLQEDERRGGGRRIQERD